MRCAVLGLLVLAGCQADGIPAAMRSQGASQASNAVFATQLAGPSTFLAPMPTAVVVLKPGDLNRNRSFCQAITSRLPTAQQALAGSAVAPNLVLTRWLVQLQDVPIDRARDCEFLVGTYDYARAARLLGALRISEGGVAGQGPYLFMVIPGATGLQVAGLDGSGYDTASLPRFVESWSSALRQTEERVARAPDEPGLVRSVFNLVSAILRTVGAVAGGIVRGVVTSV